MPAISYVDFSGGLDRRLPINVLESSKQWVLRNASVTLGKRIKKRPCLSRLTDYVLTGSLGLSNVDGQLAVFVPRGQAIDLPSGHRVPASGTLDDKELLTQYELDPPTIADALVEFLAVPYAQMFQGFPYVVTKIRVTYSPSIIFYRYAHHYVDANPNTNITDANCPQSASVTKAASRIFAIAGDVTRYCAIGAARDWTTADDAGFLATGIQQDTTVDATAVGTFQNALVVFFPEGAQIWDVATDPSANALRKLIYGVGTTHPYTLASWASDLAFLSPYGFRSMTVTSQTDRIDDTDVGVAIDSLVVPDIRTNDNLSRTDQDIFSAWIPQLGQYWNVFNDGTTSKVWAYTYSRSSKINCWSEYTLPVLITGLATLNGQVYLRTEDSLYIASATAFTDDGTMVPVEVQMAFQDAKSPGVNKQFYGADFVVSGSPDISYKYDPRDLGKETIPQTITGDTRPGDIVPVEIVCSAMAPRFVHALDEDFELTAATFYFETLGVPG